MAKTGLFGPYSITPDKIDEHVESLMGAYVLGYTTDKGTFIVRYVGRSDSDLNARLKVYINGNYQQFQYGHYGTAREAFLKECSLFHDFGGTDSLDNDIHPNRTDKSDWSCPRCNVFG